MKTQEHRSSPLKSHTPSDARPQSQMKGLQFRSIAPKAPAMVPSSAALSCHPPSALPEASTAVSPKSILVPARNYALMQVAGQEGTFSLVALPQTQQQQPIQKNLKLPIPRYQPMRCKGTPEKASFKSQSPAKVSATIQVRSSALKTEQSPDPSSEKLVMIDTASSEIFVAPMLPGSQTDRTVEQKSNGGPLNSLQYPSGASKTTLVAPVNNISPVKTPIESPASAGGAITVLSPTIFSKAVQIIPSPPKGKLPILPYAKVKSSLLAPSCLASTQLSERQTVSGAKPPDNKVRIESQDPNTHLKKSQGKRRGRKRKTIEDILAFEARKKRSLSFFRRRVPEKPPTSVSSASQEKLLDLSKKYRSIRPKPVLVMEAAVPQLVPLPSLSTPENPEQELSVGKQISEIRSSATQSSQATDQMPFIDGEGGGALVYMESHPLHRCPTCSRCFQFKHHLQSHMNSHSNLRPYVCPVCRKAYAHSGSLSTHMKLHHAESRPKNSLCCEFCEKSFGYVGVYFSHLREVHRVILTVEPSISQHEEKMPIEVSSEAEEQASEHVDPVELQIKCGRCQAVTPTFADMKLHLLYVHGEEVQVRLREGASHRGREAEDELVKHAAHYWRQLNEKRNLVHCGTCNEEFISFSKFKRHLHSHHQGARESREEERLVEKDDNVLKGLSKALMLRVGSHFNCILCSKVFNKKQEVMEHWGAQHNCENPTLLWDILDFKGKNMPTDGPN